jgi:hypothetical protein
MIDLLKINECLERSGICSRKKALPLEFVSKSHLLAGRGDILLFNVKRRLRTDELLKSWSRSGIVSAGKFLLKSVVTGEDSMRKLAVPLTANLLLSAGILIGWIAARQNLFGRLAVKFEPGDAELLSDPPSWKDWQYPGSRIHMSQTGSGHALGGIEFGNADRVVLTTPDDFDTVWAFYQDTCKLKDPGTNSMEFRLEVTGSGNSMTLKIFDDILSHSFEGPANEFVRTRGFVVESLRYTFVGFVSRPVASNSTDIFLVYRPNREFISLLKERIAGR